MLRPNVPEIPSLTLSCEERGICLPYGIAWRRRDNRKRLCLLIITEQIAIDLIVDGKAMGDGLMVSRGTRILFYPEMGFTEMLKHSCPDRRR